MGLYIDIGLGVVALIAIIVGASKGFSKQFTTFGCKFGTLIAAVIVCGIATKALVTIPTINQLATPIGSWFAGVPGTTTAVASAEELAAAMSLGWLRILKSQAATIFSAMSTFGVSTLSEYLGCVILRYMLELITFILTFIIVLYIFKGLGALLNRINRVKFFRTIDRLFGVVWALAITYVVVVGLLLTGTEIALAKFWPDSQTGLYAFVEQSYLLKLAHETNIIGSMLANIIGIQLPALPYAPAPQAYQLLSTLIII